MAKICFLRQLRYGIVCSLAAGSLSTIYAQGVPWRELWNFSDPAASQKRFEAALASASVEDALILRTQIARAKGLQKDFEGARALLRTIKSGAQQAGPRVRVHYALEWGRSYASVVHDQRTLSDADRSEASRSFAEAQRLALEHGLDALAIDALHMFAFVDDSPTAAEAVARQALDIALSSKQPDAQRWQGSIRHNLGYALQRQQRYPEALAEFEVSEKLRAEAKNASGVHVAKWMQARVLRLMGRTEPAALMQEALLAKTLAQGQPDPYVLDELLLLYAVPERAADAARVKALRDALTPKP